MYDLSKDHPAYSNYVKFLKDHELEDSFDSFEEFGEWNCQSCGAELSEEGECEGCGGPYTDDGPDHYYLLLKGVDIHNTEEYNQAREDLNLD